VRVRAGVCERERERERDREREREIDRERERDREEGERDGEFEREEGGRERGREKRERERERERGEREPGGLTREVETPSLSNSPHDHMILREDSHGRWKKGCRLNLDTPHSYGSTDLNPLRRAGSWRDWRAATRPTTTRVTGMRVSSSNSPAKLCTTRRLSGCLRPMAGRAVCPSS
jgi:hypothetical protein